MVIFLPLSSFSEKILRTEYGENQPITIGRADWLADIIRIDRTSTRFTPEEEAVVKSGLEINVSDQIAAHIQTQGLRLGVVIHRLHLEQLSRHMHACSLRFPGKGLAMSGLRDFYAQYNLSDDDFSQESAYREYSRFRKKFLVNSATNFARNVRPQSRVWQRRDNSVEAINQIALDALCHELDARLESARIRRRQILSRHGHIYIYAVRGGRDVGEITRKFKKHRANIYRAIAHIRHRIKSDRKFAKAILPLLDPSYVLTTPKAEPHICAEKERGPAPANQEHASATG